MLTQHKLWESMNASVVSSFGFSAPVNTIKQGTTFATTLYIVSLLGQMQSKFGVGPQVHASNLTYHYYGEAKDIENSLILQQYYFVRFKLWDHHSDVRKALSLPFVNVLANLTERQWSPLYTSKSRILMPEFI